MKILLLEGKPAEINEVIANNPTLFNDTSDLKAAPVKSAPVQQVSTTPKVQQQQQQTTDDLPVLDYETEVLPKLKNMLPSTREAQTKLRSILDSFGVENARSLSNENMHKFLDQVTETFGG